MDLDASLEFAIEEFRKDVQREFFGHDGDQPAAEFVAKFTRLILALSHSGNVRLTRDATEAGSLPHGSELEGDVDAWRRLPQVIDDLHLREPVISELQIVLGERYCTRTRARAHRCLEVVAAVTSAHAKEASKNKLNTLADATRGPRHESIVPLAVEFIALDGQAGKFFI